MKDVKTYEKYKDDLYLAVAFAAIGFIVSMKLVIVSLNLLTPIEGLAFYYTVIFIVITVLGYLGLTIHNLKIKKPIQSLGIIMIVFSFFILFDFTSGLVAYYTTGSVHGVPNIYMGSEDGATFSLFYNYVSQNIQVDRILTFIVTPFALTFIGSLLAGRNRPELGVLS